MTDPRLLALQSRLELGPAQVVELIKLQQAEIERLHGELKKPCPTCERRKQWARQVAQQEAPEKAD